MYDAKRPGAVLSMRSKMRYTMKNAGVVGATMAWVESSGLVDGFDGVDGAVGGLVASMVGVD